MVSWPVSLLKRLSDVYFLPRAQSVHVSAPLLGAKRAQGSVASPSTELGKGAMGQQNCTGLQEGWGKYSGRTERKIRELQDWTCKKDPETGKESERAEVREEAQVGL